MEVPATNVFKKYVILLGGNMGNVADTFLKVQNAFKESDIKIVSQSSLYRTQAWGMTGDDFLNQALEIHSKKDAPQLLAFLLELEQRFGRFRTFSETYQSRTLDIDIIHAFDEVVHIENLIIPHPRMHLRKFALLPVSEITPDWFHPGLNKRCIDLALECQDASYVEKVL
ncbi:MAG: 2-amino-4-hydroxy-6-hydroxymethyldihydropteridine diphosphokinase [Thermaurantimonas sp.]